MTLGIRSLGFPIMHKEEGEKRDFLPDFFKNFHPYHDIEVVLEKGYGSKLGLSEQDYLEANPRLKFVDQKEAYRKDLTVVIRSPQSELLQYIQPHTGLISMLHYETRPLLLQQLKDQQLFAYSLDAIVDDQNQRQVVTYEMTAYAGVYSSFTKLYELRKKNPLLAKEPIKVTILGMGNLGIQAARYAYQCHREFDMQALGAQGITVEFLEKEITSFPESVRRILDRTDLLIDATRRPDPSITIIHNDLIGSLPKEAIVLDLTADPYEIRETGIQVKAIEGLPHGTLDQYIFEPGDAEWEAQILKMPSHVQTTHKRVTVSCNAWPGVKPKECMKEYGRKMWPYLNYLITKGFDCQVESDDFVERALTRSTISYFEKQRG